MKKLPIVILSLPLLFALAGCGKPAKIGPADPSQPVGPVPGSGTVTYYSAPTPEFTRPASSESVDLTSDQAETLKSILDSVAEWTDDNTVNRLPFTFDGEFRLGGEEAAYYFTCSLNLIYCGRYFGTIPPEDMQTIRSFAENKSRLSESPDRRFFVILILIPDENAHRAAGIFASGEENIAGNTVCNSKRSDEV